MTSPKDTTPFTITIPSNMERNLSYEALHQPRIHCGNSPPNYRLLGWVVVYGAINVALFWFKCNSYSFDVVVGYGLCLARGSAQLIMLNCFFLLMLVCRSFLRFVKAIPCAWDLFPFEHHITLHRICGWMVFLCSLIHSVAHVCNLVTVYRQPQEYILTLVDKSIYIESIPALHPNVATLAQLSSTLPIWSGYILVGISLIAFPTALIPALRQSWHHIFWLAHLSLFLFLLVLMIHGAAGWFQPPQAYIWIGPPLILYFIERRLRYAKRWTTPLKVHAVRLSEESLDIEFVKPSGFEYKSGMTVYLNVPVLARHEWHPFSITSAPSDGFLSFHIQIAGDWTSKFYSCLQQKNPWPVVYLDGPIECTLMEYKRYEVAMIIGAGSGIAPFVSMLKDIANQPRSPHGKTKQFYFHFIVRRFDLCIWFAEALLLAHSIDFIDVQIYVTQPASGVSSRPNWQQIFDAIEFRHQNNSVGVFYCGPLGLEYNVRAHCNQRQHVHFYSDKFT